MSHEPSLPTTRTFLTSLVDSLSHYPLASTSSNGLVSNPLATASPALKSLFLTLHVLFPNELLPALDVLDRGLVTRFIVDYNSETRLEGTEQPTEGQGHQEDEETGTGEPHAGAADDATTRLRIEPQDRVYYVRSSQPVRGSRYSNFGHESGGAGDGESGRAGGGIGLGGTSYEVRLTAWNCSCPAFAFSAFGGTAVDSEDQEQGPVNDGEMEDEQGQGDDWMDDSELEWRFGGVMRGKTVLVCKHLLACVLVERWGALEKHVEVRTVGKAEMAGWAAGWGG